MSLPLTDPQTGQQYVDQTGRLTPEGLRLFQEMLAMLRDHEARLVAGGH